MSEAILHPRQVLKNFEIEKRIGSGGMAELFLAKDLVLKRKVVIKVLNPRFCAREGFIDHFLREARIQANLENPHIVQILSIFFEKDIPCIVMQHVEGTDLDRVIKKAMALKREKGEPGALSVERAVHIFMEMLEGIGFVHKYKIIHGDIKPANILLNEQGRVKVADFGLSFLLSTERGKGGGTIGGGTPYYMSPEQILDDVVDIRSDIYALGVTFFYMITGKFPLGEIKKLSGLVEAHLEATPEGPEEILNAYPGVTPGIKAAILKALEKEPDKRHQSCLEFSLAIKDDRPLEMYSELLRLSLLSKESITSVERAYLDRISERKGLGREFAMALEENIRRDLGLPILDSAGGISEGASGEGPGTRAQEETDLREMEKTEVRGLSIVDSVTTVERD